MLKKLIVMTLALALVLPLVLTACGNADTPSNETETGKETGSGDPSGETGKSGETETDASGDGKYVTLSKIGEELYKATYDTMLDRTEEDGYAATSITGAYGGMFVRDSSIQVMSHIANGDLDYAASILRFITAYHIATGAEYACHIMAPIAATGVPVDYRGAADSTGPTSCGNLSTPTALYLIGMPDHSCAQEFRTSTFDEITKIRVYLEILATEGAVEVLLGDEPGDDSEGKWTYPITKAQRGWIEIVPEKPVKVDPDVTYVLTVRGTAACNDKVIASGVTTAEEHHAHNYDAAAFGGWRRENCTIGYEIVGPQVDPDSFAAKDVAYFTDTAASQVLPNPGTSKHVVSCSLALARLYETPAEGSGVNVSLYADGLLVSTRRVELKDLSFETPKYVDFKFDLPLFPVTEATEWSVRFEPDEDGSCVWFGIDKDHMSYAVGSAKIMPSSATIQVDGNYMLVNAFAMFVRADEKGKYADLIEDMYPIMAKFADYFIDDDNSYFDISGLLRNPNYEHSRNGRYWDCYDLITNCFASEALHKMSSVASQMGQADKARQYAEAADEIANGVHEGLVSEIQGKKIYTELIALDEHGKVYKGFSFVSLAPIACDWYAVDDEIMKNTYDLYLSTSGTNYGGAVVLPVVTVLNDDDTVKARGDHVIGKGFAWELLYLWKTGNTERLQSLLKFVDKNSRSVYPEVWRMNGTISDSANQEHANWLIYEIARISGKYQAPEDAE